MTDQAPFPFNLYDEEIYLIPKKVDSSKPEAPTTNEPHPPYANPAKATIIVDEQPSASNQELLLKILAAIDITEGEYTLEVGNSSTPGAEEGSLLLVFSTQNSEELYKLTKADKLITIYADTLMELENDVKKKKRLWECLKALKG